MDAEEQEFWQFIRDREARLQRCAQCTSWVYPPAPVCPDCLGTPLTWEPISGDGIVWSYTVYQHSFADHLTVRIPYSLVLVELSEGPLLMGNLTGTSYGPGLIAMPVRIHYGASGDEPIYWFEPRTYVE